MRESRIPGTTDRIINDLRNAGVLIGGASRDGNVLKVRPPMPFHREHADVFLETFENVCSSLNF